MRAQILPARAGWQWLVSGLAIFRRAPLLYGMLVAAYWFTVIFLNVLPIVGVILSSMVVPGLSVGLMQAARNLERGVTISLPTLYGGLRENTRSLLLLGLAYLFATLAVLGLSALFDGGDLVRFLTASSRAQRAVLDEGDLMLSALLVSALMTPVLMAWWFAPVLVAWHRLALAKALFFSFIACKMNWRPFLTYGLAVLLVCGILPGVLLSVFLVLLPEARDFLTALLILPMMTVIAPVIFASFYAAYRDIFGISEIV